MKIFIRSFLLIFLSIIFSITSYSQNNLQKLIDKAPDNSVLNIPFGNYTSSESIKIENRNSLVLVFAPGSEIFCSDSYNDVIYINNSHYIKIVNGLFKHIKITEDQCSGSVFLIYDSDNIFIEDCDINGCGIIGVSAFNAKNLIIKDCFIHDNRYSAYSFNGRMRGIKLISNKLKNNPKYESWAIDNISSLDIQEGELVKSNKDTKKSNSNNFSNSGSTHNKSSNSKGNNFNDVSDFGKSTFEVVKEGWEIMNTDPQETSNKLINDKKYQDNLEKKYDNFSKSAEKMQNNIDAVNKKIKKIIK